MFSFSDLAKLVSIIGYETDHLIKDVHSDPSILVSVKFTWVYAIYFYSKEDKIFLRWELQEKRIISQDFVKPSRLTLREVTSVTGFFCQGPSRFQKWHLNVLPVYIRVVPLLCLQVSNCGLYPSNTLRQVICFCEFLQIVYKLKRFHWDKGKLKYISHF